MLHHSPRIANPCYQPRVLSATSEDAQEEEIDKGKEGYRLERDRKVVRQKVNFTVCIPTLNASNTSEKLWSAIKAQNLQPSEVLVLDSSSMDGTDDLAKRDSLE